MSVLCYFCKPRKPPWVRKGDSTVIESREVKLERASGGKRFATISMERIRRCKDCGYRWRTIEYSAPTKSRRKVK